MKHAIGPRKELGLRTIFNMLGPMTNPAGVKRQVIGVFNKDLCRPIAEVLGRLNTFFNRWLRHINLLESTC